MISWIFIVLAHSNNSPQVDMPLHSAQSDFYSASSLKKVHRSTRVHANQYLLLLLNAAYLVERQPLPIL
jgi:choline dehydrogenase-like flavoprotein